MSRRSKSRAGCQQSARDSSSRPCARRALGSRRAKGRTAGTRRSRACGKSADDLASNGRAEAESEREETQAEVSEAGDGGADSGEQDEKRTVTSELVDTVREAAIEVLRPVARKATTAAAKYAVTKGPELVKDRVAPKITEAMPR